MYIYMYIYICICIYIYIKTSNKCHVEMIPDPTYVYVTPFYVVIPGLEVCRFAHMKHVRHVRSIHQRVSIDKIWQNTKHLF